jgi:hypothetical protein
VRSAALAVVLAVSASSAIIHKSAADWEPLSVRQGGSPRTGSSAVLKLVKIKGRAAGEASKARAAARLHRGPKGSQWLVIALYPEALERARVHFELRFRIVEGYVEEAQAAAVTVTDRRAAPPGAPLDSHDLRREAIEYQEERPGSGELVVSALDPRPGTTTVNSGRLLTAEFADRRLGFVELSWAIKGLRGEGK